MSFRAHPLAPGCVWAGVRELRCEVCANRTSSAPSHCSTRIGIWIRELRCREAFAGERRKGRGLDENVDFLFERRVYGGRERVSIIIMTLLVVGWKWMGEDSQKERKQEKRKVGDERLRRGSRRQVCMSVCLPGAVARASLWVTDSPFLICPLELYYIVLNSLHPPAISSSSYFCWICS